MKTENVKEAFEHYDAITQETLPIRKTLITKLNDIVTKYDLDLSNCSPSDRESFMAIVNGLGGLLNDQEKTALANVKIHMQRKSDEVDADTSSAVVDLLKALAGRGGTIAIAPGDAPSATETSAAVDKICEDNNIELSEGELEKIPSAI